MGCPPQRGPNGEEDLSDHFIEKIEVGRPQIDIACKNDVLVAALENRTAVRTDEVLTAGVDWLPSADSNHGPDG